MNTLYPTGRQEEPDEHASRPPDRPVGIASGQGMQTPTASQRLWRIIRNFFATNTFAPAWLPDRWSHPLTGYLVAILLQVVAVTVIALLAQAFPSFRFPEALTLLVVIGVALTWGVGPGVITTLMGTALLTLLILPPYLSLAVARLEDMVGVCLYLVVGLTVSVLASQTERARRNAEAVSRRLNTIIEAIPDALVLYDAHGTVIQQNNASRLITGQHTGQTLAELSPAYASSTVQGSPLPMDELPVTKALRGEAVFGTQIAFVDASGRERIVTTSAAPFLTAQGKIEGVVTVVHDITELYQAQREAAARAGQLQAIFDAMVDSVMLYDRDGRIAEMNAACRALFDLAGWPPDSFSCTASERMAQFPLLDEHGQPLPAERWPVCRLLEGEVLTGTKVVNLLIRAPDGRAVLTEVSGSPVRDADGQVLGAVTIARDVTERHCMEEALRASETRFRLLAENAQDVIYRYRFVPSFTYDYISPSVTVVTGYSPEEYYADPDLALRLVHPNDQSRLLAQRQGRGNLEEPLVLRWIRKDGVVIWIEQRSKPIYDGTGTLVALEGIARDISERVRTEEALRASEERYRTIVQTANEGTWLIDTEARTMFVNDRMATMLDYSAEEMTGHTVLEFVFREDEAEGAARIGSNLQGAFEQFEFRFRRKDGTVLHTLASTSPVRDGQSTIVGALGMFTDATERKRLETAERKAILQVAEQARLLEAIVEAIPDALYVNTSTGAPLRMNTAGQALLGDETLLDTRVFAERLGKDIELRDEHGQSMSSEQWAVSRTLRGEVLTASTAAEVLYRAPNGRETHVSITGGPIRDTDGQILGAVTVARDVTERRALERRLREAEREAAERASQLEAIFEAVTDQILVYDRQGRLIRLNEAARQFNTEVMHADYASRPIVERVEQYRVRSEQNQLLEAEQWPIMRILQGEVLTSANAEDVRMLLPGGRDVQLSTTGAPIRDDQGQFVGAVLVCRDVTERRELEQRTHAALEALLTMAEAVVQGQDDAQEENESSRQHSAPLQAAPVIVRQLAELTRRVLGCQRLSLTTVEPETERLRPLAVTGLSPEQERQWWTEQEQQEAHLSDGPDPSLVERMRAGEVLLFDLTQPPYCDQPNPYGIRQMLIAPMRLGTQLVGFLSLDYGGLDHTYMKEEIDLTAAVARLVTLVIERERLLQERTEAQARALALQEANRRMTAFLSIAAHEVRTPLTTIKANIQLAKRSLTTLLKQETVPSQQMLQAVSNAQNCLDRAERQANVQNRLVRDLLDVSRIETDQLELHAQRCDLVAIVHQAIEDQRSLVPTRTIHLEIATPPRVFVQADADRIGQVISNYLSNALKYSEPSCPIEVYLELEEPERVRLSVRDEGPGLTTLEQQQVWERFYRVPGIQVKSGSGVGLGLGLYICQTIIERQGGQVGVESKKDVGSTFWFTLPLAKREPGTELQAV